MSVARERLEMATFPTKLGWMALVATGKHVKQVAVGYASPAAAVAAIDDELVDLTQNGNTWRWLVKRMQEFAAGRPVDFSDVAVDMSGLAQFQQQVVRYCRAIPYGQTRSYGELAALAGSPRAARAVGSAMARNRFGLIVPCHRVINADGSPGQYGGPDGTRTKRKLLEMEQRALARFGPPQRAKRRGAARSTKPAR